MSQIPFKDSVRLLFICITYFNVKLVSHSKRLFYYFLDAQSFSHSERPSLGRQA
jgi:hypothetical protein